jgi:hypothetical protein
VAFVQQLHYRAFRPRGGSRRLVFGHGRLVWAGGRGVVVVGLDRDVITTRGKDRGRYEPSLDQQHDADCGGGESSEAYRCSVHTK